MLILKLGPKFTKKGMTLGEKKKQTCIFSPNWHPKRSFHCPTFVSTPISADMLSLRFFLKVVNALWNVLRFFCSGRWLRRWRWTSLRQRCLQIGMLDKTQSKSSRNQARSWKRSPLWWKWMKRSRGM